MNDTIILLIFQLLLIPFFCATVAYLVSKFILKNQKHSSSIRFGIIIGIVIDVLYICLLFYAIKKLS
jgi:lipopolysaccharide export LptBFGC system permease protein LptF